VVVGRTAAACCPTSGTSQGSGDVACFYSGGEIRCLTRRRYRGCILTSLSRIAGHPPRAARLPIRARELNLDQKLSVEGAAREEKLSNQSVG